MKTPIGIHVTQKGNTYLVTGPDGLCFQGTKEFVEDFLKNYDKIKTLPFEEAEEYYYNRY